MLTAWIAWGKLLAKYTQKLSTEPTLLLNNGIAFLSSPDIINDLRSIYYHKETKSEEQHMVLASLILSTGNKQKHSCCGVIIKDYGWPTVTADSRKLKAKMPGRKPSTATEQHYWCAVILRDKPGVGTERYTKYSLPCHHFAWVNDYLLLLVPHPVL